MSENRVADQLRNGALGMFSYVTEDIRKSFRSISPKILKTIFKL